MCVVMTSNIHVSGFGAPFLMVHKGFLLTISWLDIYDFIKEENYCMTFKVKYSSFFVSDAYNLMGD